MNNMNFARAEEDFLTPPESKLAGECGQCGADIYEGEECFEFDSEYFCDKDCAVDYAIHHGYCKVITTTEPTICTECNDVEGAENTMYRYDESNFCTKGCVAEYMVNNDELVERVANQN